MTLSQKYFELIDTLSSQTESGNLEWKKTADSNTFQISFPRYSILISQGMYGGNSGLYHMVLILNDEGNKVDGFSDSELDTTHIQRLAGLYQKARRQALGADRAIDEILNALKGAR